MKNRFLLLMALAATVVSFSSCEKESEDKTNITYYPAYDFAYSDYVSLGDDFSPTFTAICNGVDVTSEIEYEILDIEDEPVESVDTDNPGIYTIAYRYVNADDVVDVTKRTVYVYNPDLEISLEGEYIIDMDKSIYETNGWTFKDAADNYGFSGKLSIKFTEILPGFYRCNDLIAKWYDEIRGMTAKYEGAYDFKVGGIVFMDAKGDLTLLTSYLPAYGDALDYIKDGHFDAKTGALSYLASYYGEQIQWTIAANQVRESEEPSEDYKKGYEDGFEDGKKAGN